MQSPPFSNRPTPQDAQAPGSISLPAEDVERARELIAQFRPGLDDDSAKPLEDRLFFHINQLRASFGDIRAVKGKQIIDVACGSQFYVDNYQGRYDPWMSRLLVSLGAMSLGIDIAPQHEVEKFKPRPTDLTVPDALSFLESNSFDAYYISAFPTRKAVKHLVEKGLEWPAIRENILSHLNRALKPGGIVIRRFNNGDEKLVAGVLESPRPPVEPPALTMPPPYPRTMWRHYDDDEL